ncbi:MAG: metallophosphoesterase [Bryobacteraceae bacterium]|jgi:hypothetical protein
MRLLCFLLAGCRIANAQPLTPAWVELGASGALARIIVNRPQDCPSIQIDGRRSTMSLREPVPDGLRPACEFAVPPGAQSASVEGQALVLPRANPSHIVVFGDTGCRIKGERVQDCNDPAKWPFQTVATQAASEKPQLMIHVGDYLYRESPCPAGSESECGGTPAGDNWEAWKADFFTPAAKLLAAVPWAFSRGNHETCDRSWRGWFYYLDPRPFKAFCERYSQPYLIKLGAFELAMIDSAPVIEDQLDQEQVDEYARQLESLHVANAWLVAHHPFWGFKAGADDGPPRPISVPLAAAWEKAKPSGIHLVLAGHIHLFELVRFDRGRPPQIVAGDGGTDLAMPIRTSMNGSQVHGASVVTSGSEHEFGYTMFTKESAGWTLTLKSRSGNALFTYQLPK